MSSDSTIEQLVNDIHELNRAIANLQAAKKERDEELRSILNDCLSNDSSSGYSRVFGRYIVEYKLVPGRTTYDTKAMIKQGFDLEPFKKVGAPYSRLSIKELTGETA